MSTSSAAGVAALRGVTELRGVRGPALREEGDDGFVFAWRQQRTHNSEDVRERGPPARRSRRACRARCARCARCARRQRRAFCLKQSLALTQNGPGPAMLQRTGGAMPSRSCSDRTSYDESRRRKMARLTAAAAATVV